MKKVYIADGAIVRGNVSLKEGSSVWYHATVRTEDGKITVGYWTNIQDNCVLHVDKGAELAIGDYVTIGHSAVVHCSRVGNGTLIGMGAILLNGAVIGENCIIGAGALIPQNMVIPDGSVVMGQPGKVKRAVTPEEITANRENAVHYVEEAAMSLPGIPISEERTCEATLS
jgi:carbonic anhydrase/acetyltransferase-like protein (isoleucine patch superfamily)